jgi:hypothetical protein
VVGDTRVYLALPPAGVPLMHVAPWTHAVPFAKMPDAFTAVSSAYC